jgi:autoinducer 2 (AI-2) kinase
MFDGRKREWSKEIADWLDIPMNILAPVNESGTVIGKITAKAAQETGLPEGLPVVQGGSDAAAGLAGGAVVQAGQTYVGTGSFWNGTVVTDEMIIDPEGRAKILPHVVPDRWQFEGVCFYGGYMVRWFRDAFCQEEKRLAQQLGIDAYKILDERAAQVPPGAYGVQASVAGVIDTKRWVVPPPTFMGWSIDFPQQSTKYVFYRALLENAAFQIRGTFELLSSITGYEISETPIVGGASRSFLWPQILADINGIPIKVPVVKESPALGAAMCAGVGTGVYRDLPEAAEAMVSWESIRYPTTNEDIRKVYHEKYQQWVSLFDRLMDLVDDKIMPPMWKAAGIQIGRSKRNK